VPVLGTGGRRFKSCYPDTLKGTFFRFMISLNVCLSFSCSLFLLGLWGIFLNRKNIIVMLMSIELMLLAINCTFLVFSMYLDDLLGQVFALFILTVAAAESSIGLALLVIYYRARGTVAIEFINLLKG
jgi:NADH-quinone oxidoreductase subunit K